MKTRLIFTVLICFMVTGSTFAQSDLNNYKYVIVPKKFDFLKEENQYRLNSLAKFLFKKYGFEALMEGSDYPEDMSVNRCKALKSDVIKDSGLFKTKLTIELKDCNDRVVYTSSMGESREKEYTRAYNEALRNAFTSFESVNYKYSPSKSAISAITRSQSQTDNTAVSKEIEELKAEIESLKKEKQEEVVEVKPVIEEAKAQQVEKVEVKKEEPKVEVNNDINNILYAQATANGYQLVDSSPKVIFRIIKTGVNNVFLVEGLSAIIYKEGNNWIVEQYSEGNTIKDTVNIKF